jgi:hypothetical protein
MTKQEKNSVYIGKDNDTQYADTLIREYKQTRWVPNSERIGKPDALSAWYSIKDLEEFISNAKAHGGDGIKLYFGAFPEEFAPQPEYEGRQTLVMVATKSKSTDPDIIANKDIYVRKNGQSKILSGLNPMLCPPKCGSTEGGMGDLGITIVDRGDKGMEII